MKNNGITEHSELIHNLFDKDQVKFNKSGSITKSKKFLACLGIDDNFFVYDIKKNNVITICRT